jgi:hypothetical protein
MFELIVVYKHVKNAAGQHVDFELRFGDFYKPDDAKGYLNVLERMGKQEWHSAIVKNLTTNQETVL